MVRGLWRYTETQQIGCRHGFWGIFLLAAWPNALFDLCGICCGHFLMPFWEFIGATMAGKALVKARPPSHLCAGRHHLQSAAAHLIYIDQAPDSPANPGQGRVVLLASDPRIHKPCCQARCEATIALDSVLMMLKYLGE